MCRCISCIVGVFFFFRLRSPPRSTRTDPLFPYTTLFLATSRAALGCIAGRLEDARMIALFVIAALAAIAVLIAWKLTRREQPIPRLVVLFVVGIVVLAGLGVLFTARSH